jgi:hypothetical protein
LTATSMESNLRSYSGALDVLLVWWGLQGWKGLRLPPS